MSCLTKPVLRGHCMKFQKKVLVVGILLGLTNSLIYNFLIRIPHTKLFDEYLKTYDEEALMAEMEKLGCFKTLPQKE